MRVNFSKSTILTTLGVVTLLGATNYGQYYLWDKHTESITNNFLEEIDTLQYTLESIGPLVDVYKVLDKGVAGTVITQENLVVDSMPESLLTDSYVLDPSSVVGKFYKVDLAPNHPLTVDVVMEDVMKDSNREIDVVSNIKPLGLKVGDYLDLEIILPNGEKYVVLSKKRVYSMTANSVKFITDATERHMYQSALVDYFLEMGKGAHIQLVKYVEPGVQRGAEVYYSPSSNVQRVLSIDPNIGEVLNTAILESRRDLIEMAIQRIRGEEQEDNAKAIASGRDEVVAKLSDAYDEYLEALYDAQLHGNEEDLYIPSNEAEEAYSFDESEVTDE